jgi:RNA polymerase sigma factor (sigma-70 family)
MIGAAGIERMATEQNERIAEAVRRDQRRLREFIRRRVADPGDVEDILQDVFYRLVEANRLLMPIEQVTAWLFRVARNRITDLFRKKRPATLTEDEARFLEEELPSPDAGPDAQYARGVLLDEIDAALDELPEEQRDVFIAHELGGVSFREMAEESGVSINTLLSRKRYAVLYLRERLREIYDDLRKG